mmetsp:Transcript_37743/g.93813  ORF Transcript_37743/g.93813 Transcript_37743/m.93813 type:complete len:89 (-) Transcript_37743:429-695(-)
MSGSISRHQEGQAQSQRERATSVSFGNVARQRRGANGSHPRTSYNNRQACMHKQEHYFFGGGGMYRSGKARPLGPFHLKLSAYFFGRA